MQPNTPAAVGPHECPVGRLPPEREAQELATFIDARKALGWSDHQLRLHRHPDTWWGERELMPLFVENWVESQWIGWRDRAARKGADRWTAAKDGRSLLSGDFTNDVLLRIDGDFDSDEQRMQYAHELAQRLNGA